jgi:YVTN family beta-propeller protein
MGRVDRQRRSWLPRSGRPCKWLLRLRENQRRWCAGAVGLFCVFQATAPVPAEAHLAFVSNGTGNTVSVIDTGKMELVNTIKVGQRPRGIATSKNGRFVIALGDDDTVQIIDTKIQEVVGTLPTGLKSIQVGQLPCGGAMVPPPQ